MKKIMFAAVTLMFFSFIACGKNDDAAKSPEENQISDSMENKQTINQDMSFQGVLERYNQVLRSNTSIEINKNVSDSEYMDCATTLIDSILKNPSSAQYNNVSVYDKDSYGRAIVCVDVSAQNSFGGWTRNEYYVCIQSVANDGTFTYSTVAPYIDGISGYDVFVALNDFGENPVDKEIEGLLLGESLFIKEESKLVSSEQTLECYRADMSLGRVYVYIDSGSKKVVSVKLSMDDSGNKNEKEKVITAMVAAMTNTGNSAAKSIVTNVVNLGDFAPVSTQPYYNQGYVYDCVRTSSALAVALTSVSSDSFNEGVFWTPNTEKVYYETLANKYAGNKDYDNAIVFYEKAEYCGDKLLATYYAKAEQSFNNGDFSTAGMYFEYAGEYKDASIRLLEVSYSAAKKYEESKDYVSAIKSYLLAGNYSDAQSKYKECNYLQGELYLNNKQYYEAVSCFEAAADYTDANEKYKEVCYLYAEQQLMLGATKNASTYFAKAGDYKDASIRMQQYFYESGTGLFSSGDYLNAADNFFLAGEYLDANEMELECYYLYGKQQLELKNIFKAAEYLLKCREYKDAEDILFGYYYSEALVAVDTFINLLGDKEYHFDDEYYAAYDDAINKVELCEGYKESAFLHIIVDKLFCAWKYIGQESNYEADLCVMDASYSGNVLTISKINFIPSRVANLSMTYNVEDSSFVATISPIRYLTSSGVRTSSVKNTICGMLVVFCDIEDTTDFSTKYSNTDNWTISGNNESFSMKYSGYNIIVKSKTDANGNVECKVTAGK